MNRDLNLPYLTSWFVSTSSPDSRAGLNFPYPTRWFVASLCVCVVTYTLGFLWDFFKVVAMVEVGVLVLLSLYCLVMLYWPKGRIRGRRITPQLMSNGDYNGITLYMESLYPFPVQVEIEDETPDIFQLRDFSMKSEFKAGEKKKIVYYLRPVRRGVYTFYDLNVFVSVAPFLIQRRFRISMKADAKVYPSFAFLHNMEMLSFANRQAMLGAHKIRKIGQSREFENIREYAVGDDYRRINWKASARRSSLMVNLYADERSQDIYSVIDKGRGMQHTFNNLSLLDYSINSSLQLSFHSLQYGDNAGLITFERRVYTHIPAARSVTQMHKFQEALYDETSEFAQSDYSKLYDYCSRSVRKRSLFILYTMFDSLSSMSRQLPYIQQLAKTHIVLVVFFVDADIEALANQRTTNPEDYATQMVAQKFMFEQKQIVGELRRRGIYSLLTHPNQLNINVINKYLEFKARNLI